MVLAPCAVLALLLCCLACMPQPAPQTAGLQQGSTRMSRTRQRTLHGSNAASPSAPLLQVRCTDDTNPQL